ncbi:MAG: PaaX family transcriptional regulator C-terminal domain-containing protein [Acidimicrobiales bacterium]
MTETTAAAATTRPAGAEDVPTRVLALGMVHHDGTLLAGELYPVAEACGQSGDQVRSCLRRLVSEGLFTRTGEGRDAVYAATDAGVRALSSTLERTRLAYHQDASGRGWDGRWHLVAFAIPESRRGARDAFRDRLRELGGAAVQPGLYVSPHRWEHDVVAAAEELAVRSHVSTATSDTLDVCGTTDPRAIAADLWPIDEVAQRYRAFCDAYRTIPETLEQMRRDRRRLSEAEFLPGSLIIGIKFAECFNADPLLPPELLPRPWPGREARDLLARSRRISVLLREQHDKPKLFAPIDDVIDTI